MHICISSESTLDAFMQMIIIVKGISIAHKLQCALFQCVKIDGTAVPSVAGH